MLSGLLNPRRRGNTACVRPYHPTRPVLETLEDRIALSHTALGPAFQVNETPAESFGIPAQVAIANDADGDFVVIWASEGQNGTDIFARIFNNDSTPRTGQFQVNDIPLSTSGFQTIDVAMDADGDFVVVFDAEDRAFNDTIFAQRFDANGGKQGATFTVDQGFGADVAIDDDGNFVVAYQNANSIFYQQFDAAGGQTIAATQVSNPTTEPTNSPPDVDSDSDGNFVIVWNHQGTLGGTQIVAQRFTNTGTAIGGTIQVNPPSASFAASKPTVAVAEDGSGFAVAWTSFLGGPQVETRIFDANGSPVTGVFQVNTSFLTAATPAEIATNNNGDFVVAWTGANDQRIRQVFARTFNADGSPDSAEILVHTPQAEIGPSVVDMDRTGNFVVSWANQFGFNGEDGAPGMSDVFARMFQLPPPNPDDGTPGDPTDNGGDEPGDPDDPNDNGGDPRTPPNDPGTPDPTIIQVPPQEIQNPPTPVNDPAVLISLAQTILLEDETLLPLDPPPFLGFPPISPLPAPALGLNSNVGIDFLVGSSGPVGEISGVIFEDINGNGVKDENEPGIPRHLVFLDLNKNGIRDDDEPTLETNEKGEYVFEKLRMDDYFVSQDLSSLRFQQTFPTLNKPRKVPLRVERPQEVDVNFGAVDRLNGIQPASSPTVPGRSKNENPDKPNSDANEEASEPKNQNQK